MNATLKTILILAALVAGTAHGQEVVLRWETDNEADARTGIARGVDARSAKGYSEFLRLKYGNGVAAVPVVPGVDEGRVAGQAAVATAGRHAAKLTDADVMRRAKVAVKAAKLTGDAAESFVGAFVATFTTARMNAR